MSLYVKVASNHSKNSYMSIFKGENLGWCLDCGSNPTRTCLVPESSLMQLQIDEALEGKDKCKLVYLHKGAAAQRHKPCETLREMWKPEALQGDWRVLGYPFGNCRVVPIP